MADANHLKKLKEGVNAWNEWREAHPEIQPDLSNAALSDKTFPHIDFRRVNLDGADLRRTNLCSAKLNATSFYQTELSEAKLRDACLHRAFFKETFLRGTNFHKASLFDTAFLDVDLSESVNLNTTIHVGSSTIGIDTLQRSKGKIPDTFLSEAGVSEWLLNSIHSLGQAPFEYYNCFISYASQNQHFVNNLHRDLSKKGVVCWYAPANLKAGNKFQQRITEVVQSREKVLVVLSKHALKSKWVGKEVELARQREGNGKRDVLLPICLDSAFLRSSVDWASYLRRKRHVGSFENWQQPSQYQKAFKQLLEDLRKS